MILRRTFGSCDVARKMCTRWHVKVPRLHDSSAWLDVKIIGLETITRNRVHSRFSKKCLGFSRRTTADANWAGESVDINGNQQGEYHWGEAIAMDQWGIRSHIGNKKIIKPITSIADRHLDALVEDDQLSKNVSRSSRSIFYEWWSDKQHTSRSVYHWWVFVRLHRASLVREPVRSNNDIVLLLLAFRQRY